MVSAFLCPEILLRQRLTLRSSDSRCRVNAFMVSYFQNEKEVRKMFRMLGNLFGSFEGRSLLVWLVLIIIGIVIRYFVGKHIAERGDLVLISKGYDSDDMNLKNMAVFVSVFLGIILSYAAVMIYVASFPTVKATDALYQDEEEESEEQ